MKMYRIMNTNDNANDAMLMVRNVFPALHSDPLSEWKRRCVSDQRHDHKYVLDSTFWHGSREECNAQSKQISAATMLQIIPVTEMVAMIKLALAIFAKIDFNWKQGSQNRT